MVVAVGHAVGMESARAGTESTTVGWPCVEVVQGPAGWLTMTAVRDWEEVKVGAIGCKMLRPSGGGDLYQVRFPYGSLQQWLVFTVRALRPDVGWGEL
jgi:hypothetical protein